MEQKIPLIVVLGPTASGKTALSIELAKHFNAEIVSADSMQIYKGMDIATAKPTADEMQGVPHHLLSCIENDKKFSVADYKQMASEAIKDINSRGKLPILVGGTGLYINSLVDNIEFSENKADDNLRARLYEEYDKMGAEYMHKKLYDIDPEYAKTLHPNNKTRVLRGIEIFEQTGVIMSEHLKNSRLVPSPYNVCMIGLSYKDREKLYDRINKRVDIMLENGLVKEAEDIYNNEKLKTAGQAIGIKELIPYFEGKITLDEAVERIKMESRRYAKRQLTWFRRDSRIQWFYLDEQGSSENFYKKCKKYIEISLGM